MTNLHERAPPAPHHGPQRAHHRHAGVYCGNNKRRHSGSAGDRLSKVLGVILAGMDKLIGALAHIGEVKVRNDDDGIDRLNRRYTTLFMVLFAALVSTKQYVGDPINCWVPAQFTNNHEEYTNKVCWVSDTYYLPFQQKKIPEAEEPKMEIGYYQWIPMILLVQAILFYVPCFLWRMLYKQSGLNVKTVIDSAISCHKATFSENREKIVRYTVVHMDSYLGTRRALNNTCWTRIKKTLARRCICVCGHVYGNYLTFLYLFIKFCYIANCVGQLFLLNIFLGTDYHMFGVHVVQGLIQGRDWRQTTRFPRVTLCDFEVRTLGSVHRHTVQCVLPINLFNEKIFIFIWFWFVLVAVVTVLSWLQWFAKIMHRGSQVNYIKGQLRALDKVNRESESRIKTFTEEYMKQDGVFVCRLIGKNAGDIIAAEVIAGLWDNYAKQFRLLEGGISGGGGAHSSPTSPGSHSTTTVNARGDVFLA